MISQIAESEFKEMYQKGLLALQKDLKELEQIEAPLLHDFAPGLYLRRILMPAGAFIIGRTHKTEHFNIVMSGAANVMIDGKIEYIEAHYVFKSKAGAKKILYILEDMIWCTSHPTDETDLDKLEEMLIYSEEEEEQLLKKEVPQCPG